jgi:hypothetical protein
MPMLQTARGVVFLQGAAEAAPPGVLVEPAELKLPDGSAGGDAGTSGVQGSPKGPRPVKQSPSAAEAAKEVDAAAFVKELEQFGKWVAKGDYSRPFEFRAIDEDTARQMLDATGVGHELYKAGGNPKVPSSPRPPLYSRAT